MSTRSSKSFPTLKNQYFIPTPNIAVFTRKALTPKFWNFDFPTQETIVSFRNQHQRIPREICNKKPPLKPIPKIQNPSQTPKTPKNPIFPKNRPFLANCFENTRHFKDIKMTLLDVILSVDSKSCL